MADVPTRKRGEGDRAYVKRVLRSLRKRPHFKLRPLSRLAQQEEQIPFARAEAQRRRVLDSFVEPERVEEREREAFDEEALAARQDVVTGATVKRRGDMLLLAPDELPADPYMTAFLALSGPGMVEALTDPEVATHYAVFHTREHPELAVTRIASGPIADWLVAGRNWVRDGMTGDRPMPEDLRDSLIRHAISVMDAVAGRPESEIMAELASSVEVVPYRESKTSRSGWHEGTWLDAGEPPHMSARFMRPDDPRFWELLRNEQEKRDRWEARKAVQAKQRAKRKEFVITKGPSGVVTAGPRRKRRKKPKRRK